MRLITALLGLLFLPSLAVSQLGRPMGHGIRRIGGGFGSSRRPNMSYYTKGKKTTRRNTSQQPTKEWLGKYYINAIAEGRTSDFTNDSIIKYDLSDGYSFKNSSSKRQRNPAVRLPIFSRVDQVLDDRNAYVRVSVSTPSSDPIIVRISGFDFSEYEDGQLLPRLSFREVMMGERYRSVFGSSEFVTLYEPLTVQTSPSAQTRTPASVPYIRTWKMANGTRTLEAAFYHFYTKETSDGKKVPVVQLIDENRQDFEFELSELSSKDILHVQVLNRIWRKLKEGQN